MSSLVLCASNNSRELCQMTLEESGSTLNQMSPYLSTGCTQLASTQMCGLMSLWFEDRHMHRQPRDNRDKWLRRCLINAKGLVFEDFSTPGKTSRRQSKAHSFCFSRKSNPHQSSTGVRTTGCVTTVPHQHCGHAIPRHMPCSL